MIKGKERDRNKSCISWKLPCVKVKVNLILLKLLSEKHLLLESLKLSYDQRVKHVALVHKI